VIQVSNLRFINSVKNESELQPDIDGLTLQASDGDEEFLEEEPETGDVAIGQALIAAISALCLDSFFSIFSGLTSKPMSNSFLAYAFSCLVCCFFWLRSSRRQKE